MRTCPDRRAVNVGNSHVVERVFFLHAVALISVKNNLLTQLVYGVEGEGFFLRTVEGN